MRLLDDGVHYVPIASLTLNCQGQDLEAIHDGVTASLVSIYAAGSDGHIPPVLIRNDTVVDGHHRILAAIQAGRSHVYATTSLLRAFGPALTRQS